MGADTFIQKSSGKTAKEAFIEAQRQASYEHGHGGYTGSIAEKQSIVNIQLPKGKDAIDYAYELINNGDERIEDKWGPAGCIHIEGDNYLFFGWASS